MTLHTDVPVQYAEIRVGDYIIGQYRPRPTMVHQGFVTEHGYGIARDGVQVRQADGESYSMGRGSRNFLRRVSASDPSYHLVDPQAIVVGDTVTLVRHNEIEDQGTVDHASPCGPDHQDFHLTTGATRCTNVDGRSWFRQATAPITWVPVTHHSDLNPGDYVRGVANENHNQGTDAPVAEGTVASVRAEGSDYRVRLEEAPGMAYRFGSRDWTRRAGGPAIRPVPAISRETWDALGDVVPQAQIQWTRVREGEVNVGDYVKASYDGQRVEGPVQRVNREYLYVQNILDNNAERSVDMDFWTVELRDRSVISTTPPSPQKEEVDSRTLNVGDIIIASPSNIGGTMRARVAYVGENQFDARTLEVLALSSNGREDDEGSIYFYDHGTVTLVSRANAEDPSTPTIWHPIPFSDLQVNDTAQGVGRTNTIQGVVVELDGPRVRIRKDDGFIVGGTAQRKWSVSNRTPAPQPPVTTLYPSIHHLKAKLFDILIANQRTGAWCSDVHEFAQELGLADNLYTDSGLQDQAFQVEALLTRLRGETAGGRGVTDESIEAAFQALGVPRHVEPPTRRFQLEIEVPASLTVDRIREMIAAQDNVTLIRNQEVPR